MISSLSSSYNDNILHIDPSTLYTFPPLLLATPFTTATSLSIALPFPFPSTPPSCLRNPSPSPTTFSFLPSLLLPLELSHPYTAPPQNTNPAPSPINPPILFPKTTQLSRKLTSLRIFSTTVTVTAVVPALNRLTPEMHATCVSALSRSSVSGCVGV